MRRGRLRRSTPVGRPNSRLDRTSVLACAVLVMAAACSQGDASDPGPSASASSPRPAPTSGGSPAAGRTEAADRLAIETAYRDFLRIGQTFDQQYPESRWKAVLGQVATEPQLSLTLISARAQKRNSIKLYGEVVPRPKVLPVAGASRATVQDCQDTSHTGQADAKTGQRRTVGIPRNPAVATLELGADTRWRVSKITYPGGSC